jgi:hypothetical protein
MSEVIPDVRYLQKRTPSRSQISCENGHSRVNPSPKLRRFAPVRGRVFGRKRRSHISGEDPTLPPLSV